MSDRETIGLDNAAFNGRLREPRFTAVQHSAQRRNNSIGMDGFRPARASAVPLKPVARVARIATLPVPPRPAHKRARQLSMQEIVAKPTPPRPIQKIAPQVSEQIAQVATQLAAAPTKPTVTPLPAQIVAPASLQQHTKTPAPRRFKKPGLTFRLPAKLSLSQLRYTKLQLSLVSMAVVIFMLGVGVSVQTIFTNRGATAQVSALSKSTQNDAATTDTTTHDSAPSTVKPTPKAVGSYAVVPDLARYIKIPKLGVNARVLQVGIKNNGELATPNNVYDAAWYTGSAKPGQPGATLIDGHVSSWTTHGVFYGIKKLVPGDMIQIQKGDGELISYRVVRSQTYDADNVDMQAAITPVTKGKSGLNLITCTGQVKRGTSEFQERILVFAEQV